jgi:hypothetical protein
VNVLAWGERWFGSINPSLLALCLLFLFAVAVEAGIRLAVIGDITEDEPDRKQITASRDSLGILLSLMLGFTLAMALPPYDLRRQLAVEEANAIGTASLRADAFAILRNSPPLCLNLVPTRTKATSSISWLFTRTRCWASPSPILAP